jgi:hypothetical protein
MEWGSEHVFRDHERREFPVCRGMERGAREDFQSSDRGKVGADDYDPKQGPDILFFKFLTPSS